MISAQAQGFTEETLKLASSKAQMMIADKARKTIDQIAGLSSAQKAAYSSDIGRAWKPGLLGRIGRAAESTPEAGVLTKAHRAGIKREMGAQEPSLEYIREFVRRKSVTPEGKRLNPLQRFAEMQRRDTAMPLPPLVPQAVS